jgi:DNA polymerase
MTNLMLPGFGPEPPKDMNTLRQQASTCTRCRLAEGRTMVTWRMGDIHSPLVMVGMGPSVTDDKTGKPYTGPAGDELDALLKEAGFSRQQIYLTNAHKCVARRKDDPFNIRAPIKAELSACKEWLDGEFQLVKPKAVVCIGAPAAKWLLGDDFDLSAQHGEWLPGPFNTKAMGVYQPTYITRLAQHDAEQAEKAKQDLIDALKKAALQAGLIG